MKTGRRSLALMLAASVFISGWSVPAAFASANTSVCQSVQCSDLLLQSAYTKSELEKPVGETARYVYGKVKDPVVGSTGGEWAVAGIARSSSNGAGFTVTDEWYKNYYKALTEKLKANKGVLSNTKYTEYSRAVIALSSFGADPKNVSGYDLTLPLADYESVVSQGLTGAVWALIALDTCGYDIPANKEAKAQATREKYVDFIISNQLSDGGFCVSGKSGEASEPDMTGMALQALAKYIDDKRVSNAVGKALECISKNQDQRGGFYEWTSEWGSESSESCAQILIALCELGIPVDDNRFTKNGNTVLDALLGYRLNDGSFIHKRTDSAPNLMASEQGLLGLAAALRASAGFTSLYRMSDVVPVNTGQTGGSDSAAAAGLPGKDPEVSAVPVKEAGRTFTDITSPAPHKNKEAIESLAARGIITGFDDGSFKPDENMTRAQFASITVRALGLSEKKAGAFKDVPEKAWYAGTVGKAYEKGIVKGVSDSEFAPAGIITRQEAAVMVVRAAKLCGLDTARGDEAVNNILAQFGDYRSCASWARESLAFCYDSGILDGSDINIEPKTPIKRCEIAQMLFNMMSASELI